MVFSLGVVETFTYHWLFVVSYWIGWPSSPEFLSDTLLTTFKEPPRLLIVSSCPAVVIGGALIALF